MGFLPVAFAGILSNRLTIHQVYESHLRELYSDTVFQTVIPEASACKLAVAARTPVTHFAPRSEAAQATTLLGDEMLRRIANSTARRQVA